jgi:hypothetical protein
MKTKAVVPLLVCLAVALCASAATGQYTPRPGAYQPGGGNAGEEGNEESAAGLGLAFVTYLSGDAILMGADDEDWVALTTYLSLRAGDRLWAQDDAKAEIRFPLGATAWVNYQSELDVTRLESDGRGDTIQLALVSGEASFDVKGFGRSDSVFQVDIPNASIRAFRAARFRVNTQPDGSAQVGVISGTLVLETPDGLTDVSGGRIAELQVDGRVRLDFLPAADGWDNWVRSRAALYDRPAASARYLPADLSPYAHEFDTSGRWEKDSTYGFVWVPVVARGWSPYSNGRWIWQANDYVWLPYDPWYAPFHFGRWSWRANVGWFWIAPQGRAYWSPGYVGWSVVGNEVSWVPLGHNEVYYGYGDYGPGTVNVHATTTVNITAIYLNSKVRGGVVAVAKDSFLRGKIVNARINPLKNPFEGNQSGHGKIIGKPPVKEIKPIRETRQPKPDVVIKRQSLPPVRLEKESITIKKRVVVPTVERSVFKPGNKAEPLKNIVKEKELERWVAPKNETAPSAGPGPAGKLKFKRLLEPQGEVSVAPVPTPVPEEEEHQSGKGSDRGLKKGK